MRGALLLAAALATLLLNSAGAQVAPDRGQEQPVSGSIAHNGAKPPTVKRKAPKNFVAKPGAVKKETSAAAADLPLSLPPEVKDLVIDSMDLRQLDRSVGTFSIPLAPVSPPSNISQPTAQPVLAGALIAPTQAEGFATASPIPLPGAIRIEPVAGSEPTILLRTDTDVGLAAFRVGSDTLLVLDSPILFLAPGADLDPAFAKLISHRTQDATVIRIPFAPAALRLARTTRGWLITAGAPLDESASIKPALIKGESDVSNILLRAAEPSRVITVLNPQTGDRLLVGTLATSGQAVPKEWRQTQFSLLPTLQGVVVAAISDDIRLRRETDGFVLSTGLQADRPGVRQKALDAPIAEPISKLFDIPDGTTREIADNLNERIRAAGNAHALARSHPRLRVAEAMLALGMDVEAQAVIDVAAAADPALMDLPRAIGLRAVASTLAGRFDDAKPLAEKRLTGSTEIVFWRAFLQVAEGETSAEDAQSLSDGLPLVLAYPAPLRDRLIAGTLEAMVLNGQAEAAQAVLNTLPDDRRLDLARGMVLEMADQPADALKAYDQVAARGDRLARYKALVRAAELRIKGGQFDARAGADALDRALFGWRGAKQELSLRQRIGDLRCQAGQWREALTELRDGREIFPEERAQLDRKMASIFMTLLHDDASRHLPPSDFVAFYDQNLDIVQDISWTEKTGTDLVERLVGLDLQGRAEPVMARLVTQSTDPVRRAVLGARLALLRMTTDDPTGAIAALAATVPPANTAVDVGVMQARQLLYARGESQRGNKDAALAMLDNLDTADADEVRSEIYAARKNWRLTVSSLIALEHKQILTANLTDAQRAIVMRLAVAATLGADSTTLARLADTYGAAMAKGSSASLFRLMTSAPARGTADLPRAFEDIKLAKQLDVLMGSAGQL
jgi:hypothetical protein